ncbi:MAG: efflux RND transporter permease subunit [Deltaproteobacteria bacterium]|nr:efflux RND transporter permease subunit [Deltaproteobacteria bacterium]
MIEKIIETSIKNRFLIILLTLLAAGWGIYSMKNMPLDAIPDLSDVQVIVYTEYPGQAPQVVEDQVTYPLTTAMLSVPFAKVVRGYSFFGYSFVYIIFEDGTDMYWARSRVLEYLNFVSKRLPQGVTPSLGPDATGVGWIYEYALIDKTGRHDLSQLRSIQDWYLRYELQTVPGVSEVAGIGGYVKQYQVEVDPNKLVAYNIPLSKVKNAIARSNRDVGGKLLEIAEAEFMIRGRGYIQSIDDVKTIPVHVDGKGTPILVKDVAHVHLGPELRRGIAELNGEGEVAGGIVVMRSGENTLQVIEAVKEKLEKLKKGLPQGVEIITTYDRSGLIHRAIDFLKEKLIEESLIVALVCVLFLLHVRSALVAIITIPLGILIAFIIMHWQGINSNIMSLGGIAIAIGAMVDASIVMIENAHKHYEKIVRKKAIDLMGGNPPQSPFAKGGSQSTPTVTRGGKDGLLDEKAFETELHKIYKKVNLTSEERWNLALTASKEVGPALFYSLLIITLSFIPVFTLEAQEGRLFSPLAFTKTYAMGASAFLAITLVPVLMGYFIRGHILPEKKNPLNRLLIAAYRPLIRIVLRFRKSVIVAALTILAITAYPLTEIGSEFMPPLNEGDLLYMPVTDPGISIRKAKELLQQTDKIIKSFPEVEQVFGKIGRADTATDPAPLSMIETTITLKPKSEWREGITVDKLKNEINQAINFPGLSQACCTMPIKTRIDMLSTGINAPIGIKIAGDNLFKLERIGKEIETLLKDLPGTLSVKSDRSLGGNYIDYDINRAAAARYGLTVGDIQDVIITAIGGMNVTETVEGLERYPVNLRYQRELRDDMESLRRILVPTARGEHIPIGQVADIRIRKGPPGIKSENARLNAWVSVHIQDTDVGTYVKEAMAIVNEKIELPPGYTITWSGQYEYMERAIKKLQLVVPVTVVIIFLLLYLNFRNFSESMIIMLSIPFALVGSIWFIYLLGYNLSVAVGVGFIALAGVAAETGVIMLIYLDQAYKEAIEKGRMNDFSQLTEAVTKGAVDRVRPKLMTVISTMAGLIPILWGTGTGSEVMKRIAAPMVGGMVSSTILTLLVIPAIYIIWKGWEMKKQ